MFLKKLKKYDKCLIISIGLDGKKTIKRKSPFSSSVEFDVFDIKNEFIGSAGWIIRKLNLMDSQRHDIAGRVFNNNMAIRNRKEDNNMSRELAEFMTTLTI